MKKWIGCLVIIIFSLFSLLSEAKSANKFDVEVEFEMESDRDIRVRKGELPSSLRGRKTEVERKRSILMNININEKNDIYWQLILGGARTKVLAEGDFVKGGVIGIGLNYLPQKLLQKSFLLRLQTRGLYYNRPLVKQWEVKAIAGRKFKKLIPYIGIRYSDFRLKSQGLTWAPREKIGFLGGLEYKSCSTSVKVEIESIGKQDGQVCDGARVNIGIQYSF